MNPKKVVREKVVQLTDLPNIGPSIAGDLRVIGIDQPADLVGRDPFELYRKLCRKTKIRHDPCVIDVFISITRFMSGDAPRPWWDYTAERKEILASSSSKSARTV